MISKFNHLRTWVEIDTASLRHNVKQFRKVTGSRVKLMAVVKSNAYGHGLVGVAKTLEKIAPMWFGVDSFVEGLRLRKEGVKNPILVLGATLPALYREAFGQKILLTLSTSEALEAFSHLKNRPGVHLKIDTGMHRQGFFPEDIPKLIKLLKRFKLAPEGVYTHFAAAKDRAYPTATLHQFEKFKRVIRQFERAGFSAKGGATSGGKNLIRHAAATGGAILFPETHCDMVRIGIGLWGYWPSEEARINILSGRFGLPRVALEPVLSWKTKIVEVKKVPAGSLVGYDLTERVTRPVVIAVLPVGYWHGFDRGLSSVGYVLVRGRRAKVLGRVSMDMTVCDVTGIQGVKAGDTAVLLGRQGKEIISAEEMARMLGTSHYEVLTRINPLIERIYR